MNGIFGVLEQFFGLPQCFPRKYYFPSLLVKNLQTFSQRCHCKPLPIQPANFHVHIYLCLNFKNVFPEQKELKIKKKS